MTHIEILKEYGYGKMDFSNTQLEKALDVIAKQAFDSAREFNSIDGVVDMHIVINFGGDVSDLNPLYPTYNEYKEKINGRNTTKLL